MVLSLRVVAFSLSFYWLPFTTSFFPLCLQRRPLSFWFPSFPFAQAALHTEIISIPAATRKVANWEEKVANGEGGCDSHLPSERNDCDVTKVELHQVIWFRFEFVLNSYLISKLKFSCILFSYFFLRLFFVKLS